MQKRILSFILTLAMLCTMLPAATVTAFAEGTANPLNGITVNQATGTTEIIYGHQSWYVIGYNGTGVATENGSMTLLAKQYIDGFARQAQFDLYSPYSNEYATSNLKMVLNMFAATSGDGGKGLFTQAEQDAIKKVTLAGGSANNAQGGMCGSSVENAILWPLDVAEANSVAQNLRTTGDIWWLRSPGSYTSHAAVVLGNGEVNTGGHSVQDGNTIFRPALKLDLSSVLFTSDASGAGMKSVAAGANLSAVQPTTGAQKLTIVSGGNTLAAAVIYEPLKAGSTIDVHYTGASTGQKLSSIVVNKTTKAVTHYGRLLDKVETQNGVVSVTLPAGFDSTTMDLKLFTETINGAGWTDYASAPVTVTTGSFTPVTGISNVPAVGAVGTEVKLTGTVEPQDATYKTIVWSLGSGSTAPGAKVENGNASASGTGTVVAKATIKNGKGIGNDYIQDFIVTFNFPATVTVNKDDSPWTTGVPVITIGLAGAGAAANSSALPNGTYHIYANGTDTGRKITVSGAAATATLDYYTLALKAGTGITSVSGDGVYLSGTAANIDAVVADGFAWDKWSDGNTSKALTITINGTMTLTASAKTSSSATYSVKVIVSKDKSVWTTGAPTVTIGVASAGAVANGSALPNGTYNIYENGTDTGRKITVSGTAATAALDYYTLTLTTGAGIESVSGAGVYLSGAVVKIDAAVKDGFTWEKWSDGNTAKALTITINRAITLSASASLTPLAGITVNQSSGTTEIVYGGKSWYVIGYKGIGAASESGSMTLLAKDSIQKTEFNFSSTYNNIYATSRLKSLMDGYATVKVAVAGSYGLFTQEEQDAIKKVTLAGGSANNAQGGMCGPNVENAIIWPLDVAEANEVVQNLREQIPGNPNAWWLRSPGSYSDTASVVFSNGQVYTGDINGGVGVANPNVELRPAFKLNLSKVLFASDASGAGIKSGAAGANLSALQPTTGAQKLTIVDNRHTLSTTFICEPFSVGSAIDVHYTGASTGTALSAMVVRKDTGAVTHYGRLLNKVETQNGVVSVTLPAGFDSAAMDLKLFTETINGPGLTDYASAPVTVTGETLKPVTGIGNVPTAGALGTEVKLTGTVEPQDATYKTIVWSLGSGSTAPGAKVENGKASASGTGTVVVKATIKNGKGIGNDYIQDFIVTFNFHVTVTVNKDDSPWMAGAPTITIGMTSAGAVTNGSGLPNGTYHIYASGEDTGKEITVFGGAATATLDYYTLTLKAGEGIASVSGAGVYLSGAAVNINAVVTDGCTWEKWSDGDTAKARTITINGTKTLTAGPELPAGIIVNQVTGTTEIVYGGKSWYVIGYNGAEAASEKDSMTLLIKNYISGEVPFQPQSPYSSEYATSNLRKVIDGYASVKAAGNSGLFTQAEQDAIKKVTLAGGSGGMSGPNVENAILWALDTAEASGVVKNLRVFGTSWWLRSTGRDYWQAVTVNYYGDIIPDMIPVNAKLNVRPACKLDLSSVLLLSDASGAGMKSGAAGTSLSAVQATTGALKLTIVDSGHTLSAAFIDEPLTAGGIITIHYVGASMGKKLSAIVVNKATKEVTHYGKLLDHVTDAEGSVKVTLPADFNSVTMDLKLFTETINGSALTDYASAPVTVAIGPFKPVTGISDVPAVGTVGTEVKLTGTVEPQDATYNTIVWNLGIGSTAPGAKVENGKVSASGTGTVAVKATIKNGNGSGNDYIQNFIITFNFPATVTVNKDGSPWKTDDGAPAITIGLTSAGAVASGSTLPNGTYRIYADGADTGKEITVSGGAAATSLDYYTLTLTTGAGIKSVSGAGIYLSGTNAKIDAVVEDGFTWDKWSDGDTNQFRTMTISDSKTLTANAKTIQPESYTATVTVKKDGSEWTAGAPTITIGTTSTGTLANGSAFANGTYHIYANGVDTGKDITVSGAAATATLDYYTLTLTTGAGIKSVTGAGAYLSGTAADINAAVADGYTWEKWSDGNTDKARTITISDTMTLTATATASSDPQYVLTITSGAGGSIAKGSSGSYQAGTLIDISAAANAGYSFNGWSSSGGGTFGDAKSASTTFVMPPNAAVITATFKKNGSGDGGGSSEGGGGGGAAGVDAPKDIKAIISADGKQDIKVPVIVDSKSGKAVIELKKQQAEKSLKDKNPVISVPPVSGVNTYSLSIPAEVLKDRTATNTLEFSSEKVRLVIPNNMLSELSGASGSKAEISIGTADKGSLPEAVKAAVGDHPMVQLTLKVDGKQTEWNNPSAPVTVSIPYKPTAAELADPEHITVWYIDGSGKAVSVPGGRYDAATGKVSFTTTHFSNYAVVYVKKSFRDADKTAWAKKQIEVLASKGIMGGRSEQEFAPQNGITRAEYIAALVRALGVTAKADNCFDDVAMGSKYYEEIAMAKKLGISNGSGNNCFRPEDTITRQDMLVLTERALRSLKKLNNTGTAEDLARFTDKAEVRDYAAANIAALVKEGLIVGSNGRLNVGMNTTRAEAAVFLHRIYGKY